MSTLTTLTKDNKRWLVYGIALNHVLVPSLRPILEQKILKEYNFLKTNHGIDVQTSHSLPPKYPKANMKYQNINANDTKLEPPSYQVTSHVDFAKLFLQNHMAKFNGFNESLDASAVLNLFGRTPVFSAALQNAANVVREGRNAWGHCNFTDWNEANFKTRFNSMAQLVQEVVLSPADEIEVLAQLKDWETKGVSLCMNASIEPELAKVVQEHVSKLSSDVENMTIEIREVFDNLHKTLKHIQLCLNQWVERITKIERDQYVLQQEQTSTAVKVDQLTTDQKVMQLEQSSTAIKVDEVTTNQEVLQKEQSFTAVKLDQLETARKAVEKRVADLEGRNSSLDFSSCEADINYYAERYDPDTRQWLLKDFDTWFSKPSESRAYVLLGDAAVGKSVMAAVIAQRARNDGNLAAAYFCRHYDGTRRDPRYLLGTIAHELRNCNSEYDRLLGGDTGIQRMLANDKLGVHELFTKLLEEPLGRCGSCKRKLVVIDALDETEYWSREDFLDLVMNRFPQLPKWLIFFITSRPEDTVQFRLRTYNPCIKICSGNSECADFYQQHEKDIRRFLESRIDFSILSYSAEDLTKKCNGMFLYAFYVAELVKNSTWLEGDIFPENINEFFRKNFERVCKKTESDFYAKLFGCAIVAPSPLPVSFISFILEKENSTLKKQEVIDAVSQFLAWRTSDKTFAFLHNLIPDWLTDEEKARELFIDRNIANEYFRKIIVEFINEYLDEQKEIVSCDSRGLVDYVLGNGIRFLCNCSVESCDSSKIVFNWLTNYRFLQHRIRNKIGIYSLIEDFKFSIVIQTFNEKKNILDVICSAIERNKYVIAGNPELLYSCLRNATKLSEGNILCGNVSASWMELELDVAFSVYETLCDMKCGAFSHDKKLFAAGKDKSICLYDASSFQKIFGPFEVMSEDIIHVEFLPDDRFVFFGRLDAWFSVQERRVVEIPQFSGNLKCYEWGSFIYDGKFVAARRQLTLENHSRDCISYVFYTWIVKEFDLEQGNTHENIRKKFSAFPIGDVKIVQQLIDSLLIVDRSVELIKKLRLCSRCAEFENLETPVRDRIVSLYADIFEYQIWNVQTGRPVIEEMFSSSVNLKPFFYLWHFFPAINGREGEICDKNMTLGNVALLNFFSNFRCRSIRDELLVNELLVNELLGNELLVDELLVNELLVDKQLEKRSYLIKNSPVECCNNILNTSSVILSKDGRWLARKSLYKIEVFGVEIDGEVLLNHWKDLGYGIAFPSKHAFTNDSNILIYITGSATQGRILCALSTHTGTKLQSISGLFPVRCESVGRAIGYIFCGRGEKRSVLLRDLPCKRLSHLSLTRTERINVAFTGTSRIMLVCSNAMYTSLEVGDGGRSLERFLKHESVSKQVRVKKCIFSNDGKLIAIHESCQLLLFDGHKFSCSVFKVEESCEHTITCLTFSPDDSLLVFCVQKANDVQSFYRWHLQKQILSDRVACNQFLEWVDCSCVSSDNTKLILCNAFRVLILEATPKFGSFLKLFDLPNVFNRTFQTSCSHCTVASDDKLLACCVANEILIYPLSGPDTPWKVPHNHSSRIEYCKFLKGNRYLVSYGIDCVVILFDILEWKSIAYTRLQESIISIALSPDEEKVVCLKSSGDVSILKLHGLKDGLPSNFQLPSNFGLPERNREPLRRQTPRIEPRIESKFEEDDFMLLLYSDFYESSDEDISDETDSDKI